jgi:CDP-glucose 4,6-dehydratase
VGDLVIGFLELFRKKKVLITGDTGFKGSWLAYWLYLLGAEVYGYSLPPRHPFDHFPLLKLGEKITHVDGDIRDYSHLSAALKNASPEFIFHLAAQPLVKRSYSEPRLTFDTNCGGSVNILEAVRATPSVRVLVFVTSDKCYRNNEWVWGYRENDELGGKDPYSASKAASELIFSSYWNSFFSNRENFGAATVRAGNVIGGGDWSENRIVPDCIRALKTDLPIQLRNPHAIRPWQHVLEPLLGYLLLASCLFEDPKKFAEPYNFGPRDSSFHTVKELAERIILLWGSGTMILDDSAAKPYEAGLLHLNCDKAHHKLGWHPRWNFDVSVEKTVTWYKSVANGLPANNITQTQINDYMEKCP